MSADNASRLPVELVDHLREVKSWVRWQWLLRGFGRVAVLVSLSLVTVFLLDFRLDLNPTARLAAFWSIGAATSIALLGWLVIPLCRRMSWSELAALADKAHPEWEDSLTSAVELNDPSQPDGFKGSPVMRQMLLEQTRQRVEELDLERVVSSRRAWRSVKLGSAACLLLAAPVFFAPSSYRQLWQRLLMPSGNWGTVGAWQIEVADGDRVVARGADVELLAKATKTGNAEPPKSLLLEWRDTVGTTDRRAMPYDAARQAFATIVPHVMRDLKFHVSVERQQSRDYQVRVVEPPVVTQVRVDIEPPAYAGWPAQSLDGAVGAIRVFERSRLKFKLEFNKPIESASLVWRQGGEPLTFDLAADKQSALMEMLADPKVFGPYAFAIADIHKLTNNDIVPRELIVVADEPPHLIVKGDQSAEVRPDDAVPIDVTATDDIGIGQLELHFKINEGKTQKLIAENVQGQKEVGHRFTLDLSSLKVEQGQWLTYKIRTTDERPDPGPHEVWSDVRVLRISTKAPPPGFNELAKTQEELRQELKQLQNDVVQRQRDIEAHRKQSEIAERTKKEPLPPERLQQLEQQIAELKQRGEKLADQLAADPLFHELGEQVRDVAEQQLPAAAQEVKQAQQDAGREQIDELRRGEQQLADAAKKLQQVEKPFQQLAELQKDLLELNRLARQADQLANRADELNREQAANEPREEQKSADAQNADPQEKANQQAESAEQAQKLAADEKQLAKDQAKLADALNDLLKRRPELLNAAKRDELDRLAQLAEQAKELAKEQQELADAIKERQQETAESAKELADRQQDLTERAEKASLEAEKQDDTKSVKPVNPESLREAVAALQEGNLDKAQKQQELAANELDRLAVELENAKADSKKPDQSPLVQAARELADEQKKLADDVVRHELRVHHVAGEVVVHAAVHHQVVVYLDGFEVERVAHAGANGERQIALVEHHWPLRGDVARHTAVRYEQAVHVIAAQGRNTAEADHLRPVRKYRGSQVRWQGGLDGGVEGEPEREERGVRRVLLEVVEVLVLNAAHGHQLVQVRLEQGIHFPRRKPRGVHRAHQRAHAAARDAVDRDVVLLERLHHTDVREAHGPSAAQHQSHLLAMRRHHHEGAKGAELENLKP